MNTNAKMHRSITFEKHLHRVWKLCNQLLLQVSRDSFTVLFYCKGQIANVYMAF